ncbi:MAG: type II secretion system protein E [Methanospirillaceae archaeon]|nr:type II secretion system protein E [Methanospirillaceae archaeon]
MRQEIRASFEMDKEMRDQIDKFAHREGLTRNGAINSLISIGLTSRSEGEPVVVTNQFVFEEYKEIKEEIRDVKQGLIELHEEIRLVHHIIETETKKMSPPVPYQNRKWFHFWR